MRLFCAQKEEHERQYSNHYLMFLPASGTIYLMTLEDQYLLFGDIPAKTDISDRKIDQIDPEKQGGAL